MRLFIALNFNAEFKAVLNGIIGEVRKTAPSGNFTHPENLHLTLAFIGETDRLSDVKKAVDTVSASRFSLSLGTGGRFGEIYWVGFRRSAMLESLAEEVRAALEAGRIPFDRKPFKPHITLAREVYLPADFRPVIPEATTNIEKISVMRSERVGSKLVYTEVYGKEMFCLRRE